MTKRVTKPSRPATYHTATRVARIVLGLSQRPHGWSFQAIQEELRVSERTLLRYIAACRKELTAPDGTPMLEVVRRGDRRTLRLAESVRTPGSTAYQALSFYFALSVLQFLDGTILKEGVEDLWEAFHRTLPPAQRMRLANLQKKFFTVPYAMKDYRECDEVLDRIVRTLVDQQTLRVAYAGLWRGADEATVHDFDPYTLATYRGGLYVIGRSHSYRKVVYLAVERIRSAETTGRRFEYPARYSPEKHTEGTFGIVDGDETDVSLLVLTREGAELLQSRRLHPTQRFVEQGDGTTLLTMRVRGTRELANWVLSMAPHVKVLAPDGLRDEVAGRVRESAALYG
jgi:predicted DNA-binding transcriptional regulator YafY